MRTHASHFIRSPLPAKATRRVGAVIVALLLAGASPGVALADVITTTTSGSAAASSLTTDPGSTLEDAASKASQTGRQVAMSLIGLGFAIAAIVLSFRRDFKEAAGVFAVGLVAILLATPAGVTLLQDTVTSLFGSQ